MSMSPLQEVATDMLEQKLIFGFQERTIIFKPIPFFNEMNWVTSADKNKQIVSSCSTVGL